MPIDFKALKEANKAKPPARITMSYPDRIAQCKQQVLNNWENNFLSSVLMYVQGGRFAGLSDKQEAKLESLEKDFNLSCYYNDDGTKPFNADVEDMQIIKAVAPSTHQNKKPFVPDPYDDIDDDIPF